jgi:methylglutaconyl-CoA hydratase
MENTNPVILETTEEGVAFVILNRPDKRNAFDETVISGLSDVFETLKSNENIRLVFIKGAGGNFSSGGDLEYMERQARHSPEDDEIDAHDMAIMLDKLYRLPQYTVSLVQGGAYGGAIGLIAACNYSIATEKSHFCFSETRLGLVPSVVAPYVLEAIGVKNARAFMPSAMPFDAQRAQAIGLIQEIAIDIQDLAKREEIIANLVFSACPSAVSETKEMIDDIKYRAVDAKIMKETAKIISHRRATDDGLEGMRSFLEKRQPKWAK